MVNVTRAAQKYLKKLCEKPENKHRFLRLVALDPNTPYAEASLTFVNLGPEHTEDFILDLKGFSIYVAKKSLRYLEGATIDYQKHGLQEELMIDTPNLQPVAAMPADSSLEEKVNYLLETEINPSLAMHGGVVKLKEITGDNVIVLQFGGGCQGCGMVDVTLREGIEKTLKEYFPEITAVRDSTDHASGENPYC